MRLGSNQGFMLGDLIKSPDGIPRIASVYVVLRKLLIYTEVKADLDGKCRYDPILLLIPSWLP